MVPATHETLTSLAIPKERTRFYSPVRTLRIAHGLTEFLRDLLLLQGAGTRTLAVDHLDSADQTDQEFFAVLLRRLPAELLTLSVTTGRTAPLDPELAAALEQHTVPGPQDAPRPGPATGPPSPGRTRWKPPAAMSPASAWTTTRPSGPPTSSSPPRSGAPCTTGAPTSSKPPPRARCGWARCPTGSTAATRPAPACSRC
ncbi:hypothetical protein GXW82_17860 [Streptacidiphilus sp. 4-A2]|nr:hypothetical protein [Streptacidiphilus sp. 4-A2]